MGARNVADILTMQDLANGHLDVQALGEAANGDENTIVTTRTGNTYPSAERAINIMFQNGGLPAKPFATKTLMTVSPLVDGDYAQVTDDTVAENNGLYQKNGGAWSKSKYAPVEQAKNYVDSYATVKARVIPDGTNFDTLTETGLYRVASNASALTMINCPTIRAGVLEVLAISPTLTSQRYTPYFIEDKIYIRASNNSIFPATWNEILLKSNADSLYSTITATDTAISAAISGITNIYGKKYSAADMAGDKLYTAGTYVGFNSITTTTVSFNAVDARIFTTDNSAVEYRIYLGDVLANATNGYNVPKNMIDSHSFSGVCTEFPSSDNGKAQTIVLDKVITIPANTPFAIVFKTANIAKISIAANSAVSGNLESRSFMLSTATTDWSGVTQIGNASVGNGYVQTGFKLRFNIEVSSSSDTVKYRPSLVMPPKIYCLANLQAHIYPEHLLPEPSDLYLHDVTCLRGKQTTRGWEYDVPTSQAAGNITLSWALHDKQTGETLNTAGTTLVVAPQTTSGNKNVLVIGDSYVNAGTITQRLLDISATDALKVNLIGTRGTGLNKHEGRGGWKVEDYATVGRISYVFTVSGVTENPAINSTRYSYGGSVFLVQETAISGGTGTISCQLVSGSIPANGATGTLTKTTSTAGDTTIAFSNVQSASGNPFWFSGAVNFGQYITTNSLTTPDVVLIQLGVNDSFNAVSDAEVVSITSTAFTQLDTLIASIKAKNSAAKIAIVAPPTYANQDAFGANYNNGQTAWRAKRNIVTWNRELYARFKDEEAQNIYVVSAGVNVDTQANFPTITQPINSHNSTTIVTQSNAVHPADGGYKQIGDAMFAFIKAIS